MKLGFEPDTSQIQFRIFADSVNLLVIGAYHFVVVWVYIGAISFSYVRRIGKYYDEKIDI